MPRIASEWNRVFGQLPTETDIQEMYEEFEEISSLFYHAMRRQFME